MENCNICINNLFLALLIKLKILGKKISKFYKYLNKKVFCCK